MSQPCPPPVDLEQLKQDQRNALRQLYWKKVTQPPSSSNVIGDVVFDTGHQRYFSMIATRSQYFKPTYYHALLGVALFIVPFVGVCYMFKSDRDNREHLIRTGQLAYKDRFCKLA